MQRGFVLISLVGGLLAAAGVARAGTIYQTGFESPTFTAGAIAGQNGWSALGEIQTGTVKSGSQALLIEGSLPVAGRPNWAFGYSTQPLGIPVAGSTFTCSFDMLTTGSMFQAGLALYGDADFIGQGGIFADGTSFFNASNGPIVSLGNWHHFAFTFDFITNTMSSVLDGVPVSSMPMSSTSTSVAFFEPYYYGQVNAAGGAYFDNIEVTQLTAVPLPPAALAGMGGLAGVAGIGFIRRRRAA